MAGTGGELSSRQQRLKEKRELRALNKTQLRERARQIAAERVAAAKVEPKAPEPKFRAAAPVNGETVVRREGGYDHQLSRLEYLLSKGVITARQCDAGAWLAARWEAYYTPGSGAGIEAHAPGSIPADPLARWTRGQRTLDVHGNPRTPPPTFRPKRPSDGRRAHDGWSHSRLGALDRWIKANRLMQTLAAFDRETVTLVAIEGYSLEEAWRYLKGGGPIGGKQRAQVKAALCRGLEAIAEEIEPSVRELAA